MDRKTRDRRLRKIEDEVAAAESKIAHLERECERNEALLCEEEVYRDAARTRDIQRLIASMKLELQSLYARWEALTSEREALQPAETSR
jgi:hypothetical protein